MVVSGLTKISDGLYELARGHRPDMHVPVRIVADEALIEAITRDRSLEQLANVATLPGITRYALGMPDMHEGYGFPVGGVAATVPPDGVVSPGGIGFDINCGVRLLASNLRRKELDALEPLVHELSRSIPTGYGRHGRLSLAQDRSWTGSSPRAVRTSSPRTASGGRRTSISSNHAAACPAQTLRRYRSAPSNGGRTSSALSAVAITSSKCRS